MADTPERRHARRWTSRTALGAAIGCVIGTFVGLIWGTLAYRFGSFVMWGLILGCLIFFGILGAFIGGLAGLESPDPGREPTQGDEPLATRDMSGPERGTHRAR
jgi:uncharacterized membrane protein